MNKRELSLVVVSLMIVSVFLGVIAILPRNASASTLYVGGSGPGNYTTIQKAIDDASPGDTIYVYNGTYYENIVVNKTLSLVGESKEGTIIDGRGVGNVVHVRSLTHWVNITGFTIENSGSNFSDSGILLGGSYCHISNNIVSRNNKGIWVGTVGNTIVNNTVSSNFEYGIFLRSSLYNTIANNIAKNNSDGILLEYESDHNRIINNTVSMNKFCGIALGGMEGMAPAYNIIFGNMVSNNAVGIELYKALDNVLEENTIFSNQRGIDLWSSFDNRIFHNNLLFNSEQAFEDNGTNEWDDGYPSGGNYWSDYTGLDLYSGPWQNQPGSDGIGDDPYVINNDSQDNYPLMNPVGIPSPGPPNNLSAVVCGSNHEDVTVSWNLSRDDGKGLNNVIRYDIYRSTEYNSRGNYSFHDSVPNGTSFYIDKGAGEGDPNNYFYYVCAVNIANNSSCSPNQAGKFTRPLSKGPNLVSIPLIQSNESIDKVLQTVRFDKAWTYDSFGGKWNWYMRFKPYKGDLKTINHTIGLWINVTEESNLTVAGIVPTQTTITLHAGWNLLGFPSFNSTYNIAYLKTITNATRIEGFDSTSRPHYLQVLGDAVILQAGYGYWIRVETEKTWVVESS